MTHLGEIEARYEADHAALRRIAFEAAQSEFWSRILLVMGVTHWVACYVTQRWIGLGDQVWWHYGLLWGSQVLVLLGSVRWLPRGVRHPETSIEINFRRTWVLFVALCFAVGVLNQRSGHRIFEFAPALAVLSSFSLAQTARITTPRLLWGSLAMFLTGLAMAQWSEWAMVIYGSVWLLLTGLLAVRLWPAAAAGSSP